MTRGRGRARATGPRAELPRAILLDPSDGGLAVARSLRRRHVPVCVLAHASNAWVTRVPGVDGRIVDAPHRDPSGWLDALVALERDGGGVLLCASDRATEFVVRERARLGPGLLAFEGPDTPHLRLMHKANCYSIAGSVGIRTPASERVATREELERALEQASYPCLLKPVLSHHWRRLFGDRRVILANSPQELEAAARPALQVGLGLLVTEHIPGPEKSLEGAVAVRRRDGTLALAYTRRKLRQYPLGFGAGALFESIHSPGMIDLAHRLLDAAGLVGIAAVEAKRDVRTGELVLIEVNVRVPQSFALGDATGVDASWRLYATLADISLPPQPPQRYGVRSVVPSVELPAAVALLRRRDLSPRGLLATYRGVCDVGALRLSEPLPLLAFARIQARHALRAVRRHRAVRGRR